MKNNNGKQNFLREDDYFDLQKILGMVVRKWWMLVLSAAVCAAVFFAGTKLLVKPTYSSSFTAYINNTVASENYSVTNSDISAARSLTATYANIITSEPMLDQAVKNSGIQTKDQITSDHVSVKSVNSTEIIRVTVVLDDAEKAYKLASSLEKLVPQKASEIVLGSSMVIVSPAKLNTAVYKPEYKKSVLLGGAAGFAAALIYLVMKILLDQVVRSADELEEKHGFHVVAAIHDLKQENNAGYSGENKNPEMLTVRSSFVMREDYKSLRTGVIFSMPDNESKVVAVTSSTPSEGKSTTAVNLALSLADIKKKTIIVDCDLRASTVEKKLGIDTLAYNMQGLSDYLAGEAKVNDILIRMTEENLYVIPAGTKPFDSTVLLQSANMEKLITLLKSKFEYIILDCTPVNIVVDAALLSPMVDGYLMVVKHDSSDHRDIAETIEKLKRSNANVIGFVYTGAPHHSDKHGHYGGYYGYYDERDTAAERTRKKRKKAVTKKIRNEVSGQDE